MAYYNRTRIEKVAEAICELRYTEAQKLAGCLIGILNDRIAFDGQDDLDERMMADLLADWAQSVEDAIEASLKEKSD